MTQSVKKYEKIITDYRNGIYGDESLTNAEIFRLAGEPNLFEQLSEKELNYLKDKGLISNMMCSYAVKAICQKVVKPTKKSLANEELVATIG